MRCRPVVCLAGTNTISLRNPHRMLRTDLAVAALFLSGHAPDRDARPTSLPWEGFSLLRSSGVARSYFYSSKMGARLRSNGP